MWKAINGIFLFWIRISNKYDRIKADPKKRETSVSLGVTSLWLSILGIAMTIGFGYLAYLCFTNTGAWGWFYAVVAIICVAAAIAFFIEMVLASVFYAIYQMKLNKKPIGLAALIVSLFIIVATVGGVVIGLLVLG